MDIVIRPLKRRDRRRAMEFSVTGMGTDRYTDRRSEQMLYTRYLFYKELTRATQVLAAYSGDRLLGVLIAELRGEKRACRSLFGSCFVAVSDLLMGIAFRGAGSDYDTANEEMHREFTARCDPDGEIGFFVTDPDLCGQGIGTLLLQELSRREKGRTVYLYTDSCCTYAFYDRRGFTREAQRDIVITIRDRKTPLSCFLYSKKL